MLVIGLTGPTGAGKGTVSQLFAARGIPVINADNVYRQLLVPPSDCLKELKAAFGKQILYPNGRLHREALGKIVFSDRDALSKLNAITHQYVMAEIRRRVEDYRKSGAPAVVLDAPQLFEAGGDRDCDAVIAVLAPDAVRRARIVRRDRISEQNANRRMRVQYPNRFFRSHATHVLNNSGTKKELAPKVDLLLRKLNIQTEIKSKETSSCQKRKNQKA